MAARPPPVRMPGIPPAPEHGIRRSGRRPRKPGPAAALPRKSPEDDGCAKVENCRALRKCAKNWRDTESPRLVYTSRAANGQLGCLASQEERPNGNATHPPADVQPDRARRPGDARDADRHRHRRRRAPANLSADSGPGASAGPRPARRGGGHRRPGGHLHVERCAPPGGLSRLRRHGGRAAYPEHSPRPQGSGLHHQSCRRQAHHRRCGSAAPAGKAERRNAQRRAGGGRRRGRVRGLVLQLARRGRLRGVHRRQAPAVRLA